MPDKETGALNANGWRDTLRRVKRGWNDKPLMSISLVLVLLVIIQILQFGFDYQSVGEWADRIVKNWLNILLNNSYVGIIALGMTFVIISGGIDLAVGSTLVAVGAVVMLLINIRDVGVLLSLGITGTPAILLGILAGLLAGFVLGEVNGLIVTKGRVPPFIVTLGTMKIYRSVTMYYMQSLRGLSLPEEFKQIARFTIGDTMLLPILYWFALAAVLHIVSRRTVFGRHVYAIGSNERTARLSGIPVDRVKRRVYVLMGVIVAIAAIIQIARIGDMDYTSAGSGYEMNAIAAVIIGGTAMSGGRGSIMGTLLGTLILAMVSNLLTLIGVATLLREAFIGFIVVAAVLMQRKEKE